MKGIFFKFENTCWFVSVPDSEGNYRYDIAWECTPDADRTDVDEFLKDYLVEVERDLESIFKPQQQ